MVARRQRDFGTGYRLEAPGTGALGELHGAVQAIVIGESERFVPEFERAQDHLLDVGGAFEEREVGVRVEFNVGHGITIPERTFYTLCRVGTLDKHSIASYLVDADLSRRKPASGRRRPAVGEENSSLGAGTPGVYRFPR